MAGPFFVAGTGRCGTSQLTRILGQHPAVWAPQQESRFLIDPGGIEDLVHALTATYTPFHASDSLRRLSNLLTEQLTGQHEGAYHGIDLPSEFGPDRYHQCVDAFLADLTWYSYSVGDPFPVVTIPVARYFPERAELVARCRRFVDELFSGAAASRGRPIWCEKTPFNLLSMPFLWELFPQATIVHIMRHPNEVAASHLDQGWAPDNIEAVCAWLEPVYRRWLDLRATYNFAAVQYVEVRLEQLCQDWPSRRAELFGQLGLPDVETEQTMDPARLQHLGRRLSEPERRTVRQRLGFAIEALGYEEAEVAS